VIMTTGPVLSRQTTEHMRREGMAAPAPVRTLADAERAHITATLRETNWVVGGRRGAAAQLGLPRTTLIARMQRLGIANAPSEDPAAPHHFVQSFAV
jgi:transcriptional regulator with GAF, ATPase, and Fis domain